MTSNPWIELSKFSVVHTTLQRPNTKIKYGTRDRHRLGRGKRKCPIKKPFSKDTFASKHEVLDSNNSVQILSGLAIEYEIVVPVRSGLRFEVR